MINRTIHCRLCDRDLPVESFYASYVKPNVKSLTCRACSSERTRRWNLANPDRVKKTAKAHGERRATLLKDGVGYLRSGALHCRLCSTDLPVERFPRSTVGPRSKLGTCTACAIKRFRERNALHPHIRAAWLANSPKNKKWKSDWAKRTRPARNEAMRAWNERNREIVRIRANARGQTKRGTVIPAWANKAAMRAIYAEAARLTRETGVVHHVDHVIPLKGRNVSGLHVETNLQILTAFENVKKHNRFEEVT